jgi:hypothetical protein
MGKGEKGLQEAQKWDTKKINVKVMRLAKVVLR